MRRRAKLFIALAVAAAASAFSASPALASGCPGAHTLAAVQGQPQLERSITCLINERRAQAKRKPVRRHGKLRRAAVRHSGAMVSQGFFSHDSPSGKSFVDRLRKVGYTRGAKRWLVGENLVWGSGPQSTPASLVESWMSSPAHRANLLRPRFREVGVGVVRGTPVNGSDSGGITVASEYGFRRR